MSLPSRHSGESPDPGDSGDFGVTDLSGDLGGSRDREAVSRMLFSERSTVECPFCGAPAGYPCNAAQEGMPRPREHRLRLEAEVASLRAYRSRGAVSADAMEAAREAFKQARQELEYFGASEDFTRSPLEAAINAYLDHSRGAVDAERHAEVLAEMVKYRAQLATAVEERDAARREVAERQLEERTR